MIPLPEAFEALLDRVIPAEHLERARASFAVEKPTTFWINPLRADPSATRAELEALGLALEPIPWSADTFAIAPEQRAVLTRSALVTEGRLYVQSLSSLLAPLALGPEPGEEVLDLAAAPGGKTIRMAVMMENRGRIGAVEPIKARFHKLRANLERAGVTIAKTYMFDGRGVGRKTPERFDRVLLDAPCSSEARFSRLDPESFAHWSPRKVKEAARKQHGLIESAFTALKPGGTLLYCTCSLSPEENELPVHRLLARHSDAVAIEPMNLPFDDVTEGLTSWDGEPLEASLAHARRVLPTETMDAFFLCRMRKSERFRSS